MPELPEAETIVRGLREFVLGERVRSVQVVHQDVLREPESNFTRKLRKRQITSVHRRGKKVVFRLDNAWVLAVNLGMTGRLLPFLTSPPSSEGPTHPAVRLRFESGSILVFNDTRRFGSLECLSEEEWAERSARLGPEPLDPAYTARILSAGLARSRSPIRSWLLDQRRIAGVGNIYANEALYLAGVHPERPACDLRGSEAKDLHRAIRRVLREAIKAGGTTIRDYRNAQGSRGEYATRLLVYGRDGEPCDRCHSIIERTVFGNRSAFFCPGCQAPGSLAK